MTFLKKIFVFSFILLCFHVSCKAEEYLGVWTTNMETVLAAKASQLKIGIISAKPFEQGSLLSLMQDVSVVHRGSRTYYQGRLFGIDTILTISRVGKVAAAATATDLIAVQEVDVVIFIGTAGSTDEQVRRGDVVIANSLVQYDMDASPFVPPFTIPMIRIREFSPDIYLKELAKKASDKFLSFQLNQVVSKETLHELSISNPIVHEGLVGSGDRFISKLEQKNELKHKLPRLFCIEMEGAAVAQVAFEYDIPCLVIRIISDTADHTAYQDFSRFLDIITPAYSQSIIKNLYDSLSMEQLRFR